MRKLNYIIIILLFIIPEISHSQDTILTLDGVRINTKKIKENENEVVYTLSDKKFKSIQSLNKALKGWSLGLGGGVMNSYSKSNQSGSLRAGFYADINKQLSRTFSIEGEFVSGKLYGEKEFNTDFDKYFETNLNEYTLNAIINLNNIFCRKSNDKLQRLGFYLKAGAGFLKYRAIERVLDTSDNYINSYGYNNKGETFGKLLNSMVYPIGAGIKLKLSNSLDLKLEGLMKFTNTKKLEADSIETKPVKYGMLSLGLTYKLGRSSLTNERTIDKSDVYNIKYSDGRTELTYKGDSMASAENMGKYIEGEEYAIKTYKPVISTIGSIVAGLTGGYLPFYGVLIPTAFVIGTSSVSPSVRDKKGKAIIPENKLYDKYFIQGYKDKARKIELKRSVLGGLAGITVMILVKSIHFSIKN